MAQSIARLRPLAWLLAIVALAAVFYTVARMRRDLVDFEVYRTAGVRALAAEPLYRESDGHYQFKYLPAFSLAMVPFAWLPPEIGKALWFALTVGLLAVFVRRSVRALPARRLTERALVWFAVLFMGKFYVRELVLGQTNALLGVVLVSALLCAQAKRPVAAGALVGLGVFVKPYAVLLMPWLIVAAGVPAVLASTGALAVGLAVPAAIYGWTENLEQIAAWYRTVTTTTAPNLLIPENVSLATMWAKWLGPGDVATGLAVATGAALIILTLAVVAKRRRVTEPSYLEFGLLMLLVPLLSPQGWDYVLLLATPALLCVVDRWRELSTPWRVSAAAAIGLMSFTIFDLLGRWLYTHLMAINIVSVSALVLVASLARLRWRSLA